MSSNESNPFSGIAAALSQLNQGDRRQRNRAAKQAIDACQVLARSRRHGLEHDDLVQDALVAALSKPPKATCDGEAVNYLKTVIYHDACSHHRSPGVRRRVHIELEDRLASWSQAPSQDAVLDLAQLTDKLDRALSPNAPRLLGHTWASHQTAVEVLRRRQERVTAGGPAAPSPSEARAERRALAALEEAYPEDLPLAALFRHLFPASC